jgi:hypothetical protein
MADKLSKLLRLLSMPAVDADELPAPDMERRRLGEDLEDRTTSEDVPTEGLIGSGWWSTWATAMVFERMSLERGGARPRPMLRSW